MKYHFYTLKVDRKARTLEFLKEVFYPKEAFEGSNNNVGFAVYEILNRPEDRAVFMFHPAFLYSAASEIETIFEIGKCVTGGGLQVFKFEDRVESIKTVSNIYFVLQPEFWSDAEDTRGISMPQNAGAEIAQFRADFELAIQEKDFRAWYQLGSTLIRQTSKINADRAHSASLAPT